MPTALWCGKFYFVSGAHRVWEGRGATWKKRPAVNVLLKFAQVCPSLHVPGTQVCSPQNDSLSVPDSS